MWYDLAALSGDKDAQKQMNLIKHLMTPAQIADAEKLVDDSISEERRHPIWNPTTLRG
jgi:hypothetical protein